MQPDELAIIDRYFRPLAGEGAFGLRDDAGLIAVPSGQELVVTTDMLASGVHFLADDPAETVAQKALRVNISDLAAKGAKPVAYVLSLGVSPEIDDAWLAAFAGGLRKDQERFGIGLLGGDTIAVPDRPVISITAFGTVETGRMVHRSGGRPGDGLYVSGMIGAAGAGLAVLRGEAGPWAGLAESQREALVQRYRCPEPRTALSPGLVAFASAAMDVSDGLIGDCDKLSAASRCSATIDAERVPLPPGLAGSSDRGLLARLVAAGDDYEILAAVPPANESAFFRDAEDSGVAITRIGTLTEGPPTSKVLFEGVPFDLSVRAFVHGRVEDAG